MTEPETLKALKSPPEGSSIEAVLEHRAVIETLLKEHYPWITRLCLVEFNYSSSALDCVQEIMLRVTKALPTFRGDASIRTWIFAISKRTIAEMKRKERSLFQRLLSQPFAESEHRDVLYNIASDGDIPEEIYAKLEAHTYILSAVKNLPERQRHAVLLHYFEDISVENTAVQLGCSAASVKTHLFRARKTLARTLKHTKQLT